MGSPQHQGEHQGSGSELLVAARLSTPKLRQSYKGTGVRITLSKTSLQLK